MCCVVLCCVVLCCVVLCCVVLCCVVLCCVVLCCVVLCCVVLCCVVVVVEWLYYSKRLIMDKRADLGDFFVDFRMCVFVSRPMKRVTFLWKTATSQNRLLIFVLRGDLGHWAELLGLGWATSREESMIHGASPDCIIVVVVVCCCCVCCWCVLRVVCVVAVVWLLLCGCCCFGRVFNSVFVHNCDANAAVSETNWWRVT